MKSDEVSLLHQYAEDNRKAAEVLFTSGLYNPCLQNVQQFYEKILKALLLTAGELPPKTPSITVLMAKAQRHFPSLVIAAEDLAFLDSIYIPSKYPAFSALPHSLPVSSDCLPWIRKMHLSPIKSPTS